MRKMTAEGRRDPAPSLIAYRMQRLWLTPSFQFAIKAVLPAAAVALLANWYIDGEAIRRTLNADIKDIRRFVAERPEFMVRSLSIEGAGGQLEGAIRDIFPIEFPASTFDLELDRIQSLIEDLDSVASAELYIHPGDVLHIAVNERIPVAVWRVGDALMAIDDEGSRVAALSRRAERADLPLLVGEGADTAVPEALAITAAAEPLKARLRGLVRVGQRRWDAVLDRDQRIMLPETDAVTAMEIVIAFDHAQNLLSRDLGAVDMRNPRRPTVRMRAGAVDELRRIRALEIGGADL
ncbi:MAG: cell division protein FtsQ/DivIB [Rhodobacter sp.]|nr:cell division protein FtsQ/DivIB [Rhodobacter sp.]